jgi:hypothetical protein
VTLVHFARRLNDSAFVRNWPVASGLLGFTLGMIMLAGAAVLQYQAGAIRESTLDSYAAATVRTGALAPATSSRDFVSSLPAADRHFDDIEWLFKLAKDQGIALGSIEYRTQSTPQLPSVAVRAMELRVNEEYPKLKAFTSELLRKFPHLYLDEIKVDQAGAGKLKATLRLSFVYRTETK